MSDAGYIYIFRGVGTSYYKIGKTTKPEKRLASLRTEVPFELEIILIKQSNNMGQEEAALLKQYAQYRTRGEWLEMPAESLEDLNISPPMPPKTKNERLTDRILELLEKKTGLTAREINRHFGKTRMHVIEPLIAALVEEGSLASAKRGKRVEYLRVVEKPSPSEESA